MFVVLSRMQYDSIRSARLVGVIVTCMVYFIVALDCALFDLSELSRFVVIYV